MLTNLVELQINPFYATDLFRYPLKTSETLWVSDVCRGYQKRPVEWNGLKSKVNIFLKTFKSFLQSQRHEFLRYLLIRFFVLLFIISTTLHFVEILQIRKYEKYFFKVPIACTCSYGYFFRLTFVIFSS